MMTPEQVRELIIAKLTERVDEYIAHMKANLDDYGSMTTDSETDWLFEFDFSEWDSIS